MCKTVVRSALSFFPSFFFLAWHTCHCNLTMNSEPDWSLMFDFVLLLFDQQTVFVVLTSRTSLESFKEENVRAAQKDSNRCGRSHVDMLTHTGA